MAKQKFDLQRTLKAIESNGGFTSDIARSLGVDRATIWRWRKKYSSVAQAFEDTTESHLDLAENRLMKAVDNGESWAVCFFLKCRGKNRGYVERAEHDVRSNIRVENDARDGIDELIESYTKEQLYAIVDGSDVIEQPYKK